jgi:hypothetical protein
MDFKLSQQFINACHGNTKLKGGLNIDKFRDVAQGIFKDIDVSTMKRSELERLCLEKYGLSLVTDLNQWTLKQFINELTLEQWEMILDETDMYIYRITKNKFNRPVWWTERLKWVNMMISKHFYEFEGVRNAQIVNIRGFALRFVKIMTDLYYFMSCMYEIFRIASSKYASLKCKDLFTISHKIRTNSALTQTEKELADYMFYNGFDLKTCTGEFLSPMMNMCKKHKITKFKV